MVLVGLLASTVTGQIRVHDLKRTEVNEPNLFVVPYAFSTETYGFGVGAAGLVTQWGQPQATGYFSAFVSDNDSYQVLAGAYDFRMPKTRRLFLSPRLKATDYGDVHAYISPTPTYTIQRPGSHTSDHDDYVTGPAWDADLSCLIRYVMPWGHGKKQVTNHVTLDRGLLHSPPAGGQAWNPLTTGRTYLMAEPFYRNQYMDLVGGRSALRSNGVKFEIRYDNTDFVLNPSYGSIQRLAVTRDWGWFASSSDWTHWEFEYRKFFSLGATEHHRQRVIALNAWISDVPTWTETNNGRSTTVTRRPPYFEGSTLGGADRMRAFPVNRFHDRSALYYCAEYRAVPQWNPLENVDWLPVAVDWFQWVVLAEFGRVAGDLSLKELHEDMQWDVGVGVRALSEGGIGRLDVVMGEDSWSFWAMFGQPF